MKTVLLIVFMSFSAICYGQQNDKISTLDFIEIIDGNIDEAIYYYQNNWQVLRDMAIEKAYIDSYQVLETPKSKSEPFDLILITTYTNQTQYDLREEHFSELIEASGDLKLLNEKQPAEFRKNLFGKEMVKHW